MSEHDKMMAFGHWLTNRLEQQKNELFSLSINRTMPIDGIRIKAGHIEDCTQILGVFTDLYKGDLNKFNVEYLGAKPEPEEDKESTNDQNTE